ncbi:restriction endonuclease-like protein [Oceanobacillus sp. FSL K6-2867]|uniref:restriction endonuclease-like protein n=1 Tax=Oceanobacillus sp. FSL K6-2867 TaxID=2954748 RepID=UPI0030D728CA
MASLHSGSVKTDVELLYIETDDMTVVIKGKPYHEKFEGLAQYRNLDLHDSMRLMVHGECVQSVQVFDINNNQLQEKYSHRPIFFENGVYQLIVSPKGTKDLSFYHEHQGLRNAVDKVTIGDSYVLMGNLQFRNEVGLSTFEIRCADNKLLTVTMEVFPTKLDYRKDYQKLLEEVNDEIYNLAYHFIKKTYLGAKAKLEGTPSRSEFLRLIESHFDKLFQAIHQIERQPNHKLTTTHTRVRGDQLGRQDQKARHYLKKRPHLFVEVKDGISIDNKSIMPTSGLNIKKELTYDTHENRFIKWMMNRLIEKLEDLIETLQKSRYDSTPDEEIINCLSQMKLKLKGKINNQSWRNIGKLDRSVMSLVLQMASGYREAFQIYLLVSRGLALQGNIYKMSVKDVATLYEYWTYLKLGQILGKKYEMVDQDIIKVNREGLFVNLQPNATAKRVYRHPQTKEKITLIYQKRERKLPTITQVPDTMLSIEKKGKDYEYQYVFDAKYRIDFALAGTTYGRNYHGIPGPMEEDINTMHRYRDSIVVNEKGPFERKAFGAYVLFPWDNEEIYQEHKLYKSIEEVNIGGLPFLPNATSIVEQFVERLIDKSPEEIQQEGILPRGTLSEWESTIEEKVIVVKVSDATEYKSALHDRNFKMSANCLSKNWQEAKYIALYTTREVVEDNGVNYYAKIKEVRIVEDEVWYDVDKWKVLSDNIKPVGYGISNYIITRLNNLLEARELPELFMKSNDERTLCRILARFSDRVRYVLDDYSLDVAKSVESFSIKNMKLFLKKDYFMVEDRIGKEYRFPLTTLRDSPSKVFNKLAGLMEDR